MDTSSADGTGDNNGLADAFLTGGQFVVEAGDGEDALGSTEGAEEDGRNDEPLREQDRFLPIANVARIMKKGIPNQGKIAKDAKECVQECVSEFISFITSESLVLDLLTRASERCQQEKRKTINGEDILFAMSTLGFDNYVEPLKLYLQKYRESTKGDKALNNVVAGDTDHETYLEETFAQSIPSNILTTDGSGQQNVIYTTAFANQISFQS